MIDTVSNLGLLSHKIISPQLIFSSKICYYNIIYCDVLVMSVIMMSCRSVYGEKAMKEPERTNEMAGVYARHCVELAKDLGIPAIDLWSKMQETEGWQKKFLRFVI